MQYYYRLCHYVCEHVFMGDCVSDCLCILYANELQLSI